VPGRGFADCVRAVRKPARPAPTPVCEELAARVADGVTSWRCHEARDRTEPWAERSLARAAVERRKASASPQKERAPRKRNAGGAPLVRDRGIYPRAFRRSASLIREHDLIRKP
jgi:hypothetical protein